MLLRRMILPIAAPFERTKFTLPVRIVVVDDHVFMRELIGARLARQRARYKVLAEVGDAAGAIDACRKLTPDLLILDINLPDQSGIAAVPAVKRASPATSVLLCSAFASEDRIIESIRCGADGFVEKTNTWNEFLDAVDRVSGGERFFRSSSPQPPPSRTDSKTFVDATRTVKLTPREVEVLTVLASGSTSKEIAARLFISVQTVETHRSKLMNKLGVRNAVGLALYAVRNGFIKVPLASRS